MTPIMLKFVCFLFGELALLSLLLLTAEIMWRLDKKRRRAEDEQRRQQQERPSSEADDHQNIS
jgi:hypothetical protein